jgi:hypothetical protein
MTNDDTAARLTPQEIADRHRLAAELMRQGSPADLPPHLHGGAEGGGTQQARDLMVRLLLDPPPVTAAGGGATPGLSDALAMTAPAVPMPSAARSRFIRAAALRRA